MYAFVEKAGGRALVVFRFDDPEKAVKVLSAAGVGFLSEAQVKKL